MNLVNKVTEQFSHMFGWDFVCKAGKSTQLEG